MVTMDYISQHTHTHTHYVMFQLTWFHTHYKLHTIRPTMWSVILCLRCRYTKPYSHVPVFFFFYWFLQPVSSTNTVSLWHTACFVFIRLEWIRNLLRWLCVRKLASCSFMPSSLKVCICLMIAIVYLFTLFIFNHSDAKVIIWFRKVTVQSEHVVTNCVTVWATLISQFFFTVKHIYTCAFRYIASFAQVLASLQWYIRQLPTCVCLQPWTNSILSLKIHMAVLRGKIDQLWQLH